MAIDERLPTVPARWRSSFNKLVLGLAAVITMPLCHAAVATPYNLLTAPDPVSRAILARPVAHFEEGATSNQDIPAAIHRNYPQIVEQNFARMNAADMKAFVDQLSDAELRDMAQLYVNANADAQRAGRLLLVSANRMDGPHLARLSRFFGYAPVYDAILQASPTKAQSFAQSAPIAFAGAQVGAFVGAGTLASESRGSLAASAALGSGGATPMMGFAPTAGMTLSELYIGFRGMAVGRSAATAALYETALYAGACLYPVYAGGTYLGSTLTSLGQTYARAWYYGTFVTLVGAPVTWIQSWLLQVYKNWADIPLLAPYEQSTSGTFGVPSVVQEQLQGTGGDFGVADAWYDYYNVGGACPRGEQCPTHPEK